MKKYSYVESGVDVKRGDMFASYIKDRKHMPSWVYKEPTGYASILTFTQPPIVVTADGIGSKLLLHVKHQTWEEAAKDLVAMNYNDIVSVGGIPIAFLDYLGVSEISKSHHLFIDALLDVLKDLNMELVAGETAELPDIYDHEHWDIAGFSIGIWKEKIPIETISQGDVIIGIPANGFHSNGWSLIRKIISEENISIDTLHFPLLKGTRIYKEVIECFPYVKGLAHVTGGGILRALSRVLLNNGYVIRLPRREYIDWVLKYVSLKEALSTFNMGIGMIVITDPNHADKVLNTINDAIIIGTVSTDTTIHYGE